MTPSTRSLDRASIIVHVDPTSVLSTGGGTNPDTPTVYEETVKVLVFGSREWIDQGPVERELRKLPAGTVIVHGAARGADNIAGYVGEKLGLVVRRYPAEWMSHGRAAGPIRNARMLKDEHPDKDGVSFDLAICFHKDPGLGIGSRDMKARCDAVGIRVDVHHR